MAGAEQAESKTTEKETDRKMKAGVVSIRTALASNFTQLSPELPALIFLSTIFLSALPSTRLARRARPRARVRHATVRARTLARPTAPPGEVTTAAMNTAIGGTSANSNSVATLDAPLADPGMKTLWQKINELLAALKR